MYGVLYLCAPAISRFYDLPLLCDVLRVQGVIVIIYAFNIVQSTLLRKHLNFKTLAIINIVTSVISLSVTIFMAYKGFGVWALVAQNVLSSGIPALIFWFVIKWRPKFTFSSQSFKELFGFGFYMFMSHLVNKLCARLTSLLIGKLYSPITLGYYSKAMNTEQLASHSISSVLTQVTYPLYAQVQDDKARLANMVRRLTAVISFITFPMIAILVLTAKSIFVLLYSDRWLESVPYFQLLALIGLSECLQAVNVQTIAAIGKSRLMFQWTLIKRGVGMTFVIGGLYFFGIWGLMVGVVLYNWFCYFVNIGLVSKHIGYRWQQQLLDLMPVALVSIIGVAVGFGLSRLCNLSLYPDGILRLLVFVVLYVVWIALFKPAGYGYFLSVIPERYRKYISFLYKYL